MPWIPQLLESPVMNVVVLSNRSAIQLIVLHGKYESYAYIHPPERKKYGDTQYSFSPVTFSPYRKYREIYHSLEKEAPTCHLFDYEFNFRSLLLEKKWPVTSRIITNLIYMSRLFNQIRIIRIHMGTKKSTRFFKASNLNKKNDWKYTQELTEWKTDSDEKEKQTSKPHIWNLQNWARYFMFASV